MTTVTLTVQQQLDVANAMNNILMCHRMVSTGNFDGYDPKDIFHRFNDNAAIVNNTLQFPVIDLYQDEDGLEY